MAQQLRCKPKSVGAKRDSRLHSSSDCCSAATGQPFLFSLILRTSSNWLPPTPPLPLRLSLHTSNRPRAPRDGAAPLSPLRRQQ